VLFSGDGLFFSFWCEAEPDDEPKNWVISAGGRKVYRVASMVASVGRIGGVKSGGENREFAAPVCKG